MDRLTRNRILRGKTCWYDELKRFSIEWRKTQTKEIITANRKIGILLLRANEDAK